MASSPSRSPNMSSSTPPLGALNNLSLSGQVSNAANHQHAGAATKQAPHVAPLPTSGGAEDTLPPLESLKCRLCGDYLRNPLTLECLHSFCASCLLAKHDATEDELDQFLAPPPLPEPTEEELQREAENQARAEKLGEPYVPAPRPTQPEPRRMHCPTCTEVLHAEPSQDPTEPFRNQRLGRIVKLVHETPVVCQNCKASESEIRCSTCNAFCCRSCWNKTHAEPIFAMHTGVQLRHSEMSALPKCPHHPLNDQEFFVTDEEVGTCQVCMLKGNYVGAPYALVSDVRAQRQAGLAEGLEEVAANRARLVEGRDETMQVAEELDENLEKSSNAVKSNFKAIREALDRREEETLRALKALRDAKAKVLSSQILGANRVIDQIDDGVYNVDLVLKHSNPLEIIFMTEVLDLHINHIGNVPSTAPRVCASCAGTNEPCHHPAVDGSLPVILSDRVPAIVSQYAAVPDASSVVEVATGLKSEIDIAPRATDEQINVLRQVSAAGSSQEEWGCSVM